MHVPSKIQSQIYHISYTEEEIKPRKYGKISIYKNPQLHLKIQYLKNRIENFYSSFVPLESVQRGLFRPSIPYRDFLRSPTHKDPSIEDLDRQSFLLPSFRTDLHPPVCG